MVIASGKRTFSRAKETIFLKKERNGNSQWKKDEYLKLNNSVDGLTRRIERTEETFCKLEDRPVEIAQAEEEREKWSKKNQ